LVTLFGSAPLRTYTKETVGAVLQLAETCMQIKSQGFATDDGEFREGLRCVAAPIRTARGLIIGSIGISAPVLRFPDERYQVAGEQVHGIAAEISAQIGFSSSGLVKSRQTSRTE
jgi:DNA-binding IclR family transcriptional regulator